MKKLSLIANIAPHYRKPLWLELLKNKKFDTTIIYGLNNPTGIKSIDFKIKDFLPHINKIKPIQNIWLFNSYLIYQLGLLNYCLKSKSDIYIFVGDMYNITTWIASLICRFKKSKVIFWGHGLYGNESFIKLEIRKMFYRLANKHLVYEKRSKSLLIKEGFAKDNIFVIFNSLDYKKQILLRNLYKYSDKNQIYKELSNPNRPVLIFIGRLTAVKKIDFLVKTITKINKFSHYYNLVIIGGGVEQNYLEELGKEGISKKWLLFKGPCYDENKIAKYLSAADLCISPGNIGLTAIHSLSYGTPVCTHGDMSFQMPEVEAIKDGFNGIFFERNNMEDLKTKILEWFSKDLKKIQIQERCYQVIDKYYNPEYQLKVFERIVENEVPEL